MRNLIIYVDDDLDDLEIMSEVFAEIPEFRLICLENSDQLMALVDQNLDEICLVVMDVNMPVYGIDLLSQIKNNPRYKALDVVMISSSRSPKEKSAIERLHSELVEKPSSIPEIKNLAEHLAKHCS
ncbi:MAG: response regulator [Flavisolibacter sp.]